MKFMEYLDCINLKMHRIIRSSTVKYELSKSLAKMTHFFTEVGVGRRGGGANCPKYLRRCSNLNMHRFFVCRVCDKLLEIIIMTAGKPGVTPSDWAPTPCGGVSPPQEFTETRLFVSLGTPVEY